MDHQRPAWDDYFMSIAKIIATRSTCDRLRAGSVLVKNNRIISTGYNGAPPGMPHCDGESGHKMEEGHCVRTVHSEENCILQAAVLGGTSTQGSTLYTTYSPCYHCFKKLVVGGVKRMVVGAVYRDPSIKDACALSGIELVFYQPNAAWLARLSEAFAAPIEEKLVPDNA